METPNLFSRVLVGVNADDRSSRAAALGFSLVDQLGSELHLVHAVHLPPPLWPGVDVTHYEKVHTQTLDHSRERVIATLSRSLGLASGELADRLTVRSGHPAKVILDRVKELEVDLVVVGTHVKRFPLDIGSTSKAILSRAGVPVWSQTESVQPIRRILVPVDFSEHSVHALDLAHQIAVRHDALVRVLYCYEAPSFAYMRDASPEPTYAVEEDRRWAGEHLEKFVAKYDWGPVRFQRDFVEGSATKQILVESQTDDLIVMGTHGRTGFSRFMLGSVAYGVVRRSSVPTLVVPSPNRSWLQEDEAQVQLVQASVGG